MSENGMQKIDEKELSGVAGGVDEITKIISRVPEGNCECGKTKYRITESYYTENGPGKRVYTYCDACGPLVFFEQ
ncbi:MAG: hypothetical protein K6F31_11955 [Acetatifactor sp.]|nr:hypothetical protein [Acetatifactor sp.]